MMNKMQIGKTKTKAGSTSKVKPPKAMKLYRLMDNLFTKQEYLDAGQLEEYEVDHYLRWLIKFRKVERMKSGNYRKL